MRILKVAAAVLNQTPLDWAGNAARIRGAIAAAREQDVSVLCLPEMCITGYGCEDAFLAPLAVSEQAHVVRIGGQGPLRLLQRVREVPVVLEEVEPVADDLQVTVVVLEDQRAGTTLEALAVEGVEGGPLLGLASAPP